MQEPAMPVPLTTPLPVLPADPAAIEVFTRPPRPPCRPRSAWGPGAIAPSRVQRVTVEVDGSPVGHTPGRDGLVAIDLAAGRHDLLIRC
jgi:hypothetical protein